jgi:8-oxo-dGTP diphosphatase
VWHPQPDWRQDLLYLRGLELMAHRYWWEAHEVWEGMWHQRPREHRDAQFLQSLIQACACGLQVHMGRRRPAERLAEAAVRRLEALELPEVYWGVAHGRLRTMLDAACRQGVIPDLASLVVDPPGKVVRVVCGVLCDEGRALAALRGSDAARGDLWEFPGGKVELGESDEVALARELDEELGIGVTVGAWLAEAVHRYPDITIRLVAYACALHRGTPVATEHAELRWATPDELRDLCWAPADVPLIPAAIAHVAGRS